VERHHDFAPAWKELSVHAPDAGERRRALREGLSLRDVDRTTASWLRLNRALQAREDGEQDRAKELLEKIVADDSANNAARAFAHMSLQVGP